MYRFVIAGMLVWGFAPLANACNCSSGGSCHCGTGACGCGGATSTATTNELVALAIGAPQVAKVGVENFFFSASTVTIHAGDTIEWDWDTDFHTVTSVAGSAEQFDSTFRNTGAVFSHTFNQVGTFNYYCQAHGFDNGDGTAGGMAGTIKVLAAPEPGSWGVGGVAIGLSTLRRRRPRGGCGRGR